MAHPGNLDKKGQKTEDTSAVATLFLVLPEHGGHIFLTYSFNE